MTLDLKTGVRVVAGHVRTALPPLIDMLRPARTAAGLPLRVRLNDAVVGPIELRAVLDEAPGADSLVVVVHGIGGVAGSSYCLSAARAASAAGCAVVRISLRGAECNGDDIYHAGLTDDLEALLAHPRLARYRRIFLLGYSLGGNIALRAAINAIDPRLAGVAAICPPLDLRAAMENFDRKPFWLHKKLMNGRANRSYAAVERRGRAHSTIRELQQARSCAEWNQLTIVRRFGFRDANHYYEEACVARDWRRLSIPALLVFATYDPVVPRPSVERKVAGAPANVHVRWMGTGGHISFPRRLELEKQCIEWLIRHQRFAQEQFYEFVSANSRKMAG